MQFKKTFIYFNLLFLFSYLAFSLGSTLFVPYLTNLGFDALQRGTLLSSIAVAVILFQLVGGYVCDKFKTIKKVVIISLLLFVLAVYLFYNTATLSFIYFLIMIAMVGGFFNLLVGLCDSWVLQSGPKFYQSYSSVRAIGSLGWAIGATSGAYVTTQFGYQGLSFFVIICSILAIVLSLFIKDAQNSTPKQDITLSDVKVLLKNNRYIFVTIILFIIFCVNNVSIYAVVDKILILGGDASDVGLKWFIHASFEIPMFLLGTRLLKKFNGYVLLAAGAFFFFIQFTLFSFATSIEMMMWIQALQFLTYPLIHISSKVLIYDLSPDHLKATGQLFSMSIFTGVSALITPILIGVITTYSSIDTTLMCAALAALASIGLIYLLVNYKKGEQHGQA